MARTIDEVYQSIIAQKNNTPELDELNSSSKVAIYNLFAYIVAVVIVTLENLFDLHKSEVADIIATKKPHTLKWYRDKALLFQYGQDLMPDSDAYANTGLSDEDIAAQMIVTQASVTEIEGRLRVKVAKDDGADLTELSDQELISLTDYMSKIKDAGVKVITESLPPDTLKLEIDIWYNPLVLTGTGSRTDGESDTTVKDSIKAYLKNLPFNGEYSNTKLIDALQKVDGVIYPVIKTSQAKYGLLPFVVIDEKYIPDAGYLRVIDSDLTINYRQYVQS